LKPRALAERAAHWPFGPAFISRGWDAREIELPDLVSTVVTRVSPLGLLVAAGALVDRTCLGIKDALLEGPLSESDLVAWMAPLAVGPGRMDPCDVLVAQSIVYHALDYARSLGFSPHPDFHEAMFGPRPEVLIDTPFARPDRPIYVMGSRDNPAPILAQLKRAVGRGNFDFVLGTPVWSEGDEEDAGFEDDEDEFEDEDLPTP